jgi:chromosome segregation ATPase
MSQDVRKRVDQAAVWEACDGLLGDGRRPTIERIRERVGGSPNTISIHMESWFMTLSARMGTLRDGVAVPHAGPGMPDVVLKLAKQLWEGARTTAKLEADKDVESARQEAEAAVGRAEEARRRAEAALAERGERVLALEAELARGVEERRTLEREGQQLSEQLGSAKGRLVEVERAMVSTQADLRDARQAVVESQQQAAAALKAQSDQHQSDRKGWMLEIDRARGEAAKAAKREEQVGDRLKAVQQEYATSRELGAQLEVRLEQALNECARLAGELKAVQAGATAAEEAARGRESDLLARLDEASRTTEAMAAEVREAQAAIERLREDMTGKLDTRKRKTSQGG